MMEARTEEAPFIAKGTTNVACPRTGQAGRTVRRRYFRANPSVLDCDTALAMRELGRHGVTCFTGADYESVLSLYEIPGTQKADFKRRFDIVCVGTDEDDTVIDRLLSGSPRLFHEIIGADRNTIERMVRRFLDVARHPGMNTRGLPTAVEDKALRPYQAEMKDRVIAEWRREPRVMLQMPTGTGKTRLFVSLINDIHRDDPSARVLIVAHRRELVEQASETLSAHYRLSHGILGRGKNDADSRILLASIQKLSRMKELPSIDYVIIDEAHHSLAPSYRELVERCPSARILGVTATPCRLRAASFKGVFGALLLSPPTRRFINAGYLADYRLFTVSDKNAALRRVNRLARFGSDGDYRTQDLQDIVNVDDELARLYDYYRTYADGRKGIVYAVSRGHAARIAAMFNAKGVSAVSLDCDTPAGERARIVNEFKSGKGVKIMVNVELFTEGFDCPAMEFVMLARPTRSLAMYLQQVGRALRPSPGGSPVAILDAVGLYNRFGLPERQRDWQRHFLGERPQGEDYWHRPLGTGGITGLMKEVTAAQAVGASVVERHGSFTIRDFCGGRLGICDKDVRKLFPALYDRLSAYADGKWLVGTRRDSGKDSVVDILVPESRVTHTFIDFREEGNGLYSVGLSRDRRLRFDSRLRLVPASSCELGGMTVYRHGEDRSRSLYTLSLRLGSMAYTNVTRYVSGVVKLTNIWNGKVTLLCRGEIFDMSPSCGYNNRHFYSEDRRLHVYSDGTVYRRVSDHPLLYQATQGKGITLCDKYFRPLCHGDYIETVPGGCMIYKGGKPFQTVLFVDYICKGIVS